MTEGGQPLPSASVNPAQRYDRQIRIWGEQGQAALERASVCLINASAVGTETLKNLVLPGIGSFTVIDGADVTIADFGNNFFLYSATIASAPVSTADMNDDSVTRNRALAATEAMHELNDSVAGSYIPQHVASFIRNEEEAFAFFKGFSVVIASQMSMEDPTLRYIASGCYKANIPLIVCRAYGLLGYVRIQARELCVLDGKLDDVPPDLRLYDMFEELEAHVNAVQLEDIADTTIASHVPYVVILAKAVRIFRQKHSGNLPKTRDEKSEFAEVINSLRPKVCPDLAENFEEALRYANLRLCFSGAEEIPYELRHILSQEKSNPKGAGGFKTGSLESSIQGKNFPEIIQFLRRANRNGPAQDTQVEVKSPGADFNCGGAARIADENVSFWLHVAALRAFIEETGRLPVRGSLPDMTADTESYVHLQTLYSKKAEADAKIVAKFCSEIAERFGLEVEFDDSSVRQFCKRATSIRVYRTRSIIEEMARNNERTGGFMDAAVGDMALEPSRKGSPAAYYAVLRSLDLFKAEHGRDAGINEAMLDTDLGLVCEYLNSIKEELGVTGKAALWRDEVAELMRYASGELHNVAAFVGGVVGQEVTKVITRQFIPLADTLVINFSEQSTVQFKA